MKTNEAKRKEHKERIVERNLTTDIEQLEKLNAGRHHAKKERLRLALECVLSFKETYNPRNLVGKRVIFNPED